MESRAAQAKGKNMPVISHHNGMDPESFDAFTTQLDRFVRETLIPAEPEVIATDRVPPQVLTAMRDLGLFGLTIPESHGGAGLNISQYVDVIRRLGYAAPAFRSVLSIGTGMVTSALKNGGTEAQKAHWLPRLAAGAIASFALTEPDSGSDSAALATRATRTASGYRLSGTKRYITNAPMAEFALVMARTAPENLARNAHVSAFLVPLDLPGVTVGKPDRKMGQAGALIADIVLEDVEVPADALLGEAEGKGFEHAMRSLDTGRLSVAAAATGYATRALDTGLRYATDRRAFGQPIASFQLIQAMLADSRTELYAAQCMIADACRRADEGHRTTIEAAAAKVFASEMCGRVTDRVVQIHGGAGYLAEYEAERFYRDARLYRIYEGTTQILQLLIARTMLKDAAAGV
jgi:acyl-CoA dehydrogenase